MKIALVTTTINVPSVLKLYRKLGPDVRFFVAFDKKTPDAAVEFCTYKLGGTHPILVQAQQKYACSELIGWNCIQRRNIATLEALKWGADLIVSIDDDNLPMGDYFAGFERLFMFPTISYAAYGTEIRHDAGYFFNGLQVGTNNEWFDPGQMQFPNEGGTPVCQRGFPQGSDEYHEVHPILDARIGVAQGLCLGDPDTSAVDRMALAPEVHQVSELYRSGVVVNPKTKTVFNSQNTAFIRELTPAFFMFPGIGRYDDIFASLVMRRIMRERGFHVHFGQPFVYQQRNQHDLIKDLKAEIWGMEHIERFAAFLDQLQFSGSGSVLEDCQHIVVNLSNEHWFPLNSISAFAAFLLDCEKVMG